VGATCGADATVEAEFAATTICERAEYLIAARIAAMDTRKPIIPIDLLLIVGVNVIVAVAVYYLIVLWSLLER
jgi:hypothetical protein